MWDYDSTPQGAVTFASTGGDGVHFSGISTAARALAIVMTVPMQFDRPNVVVGYTVRDFLAPGCCHVGGYFTLEQLAYDWDETVSVLEAERGPNVADEPEVLTRLRSEWRLAPWADVRSRLDSLQSLLIA